MKTRIVLITMMVTMLAYGLTSCYSNKEDIIALPKVSFRGEVVPILTAGPCGCHTNGFGTRTVQFMSKDTILYDVMLARVSILKKWVNGGTHPGAGTVDFTDNEKIVIRNWIDQGAKDDGETACTITGVITYTKDIVPIYKSTCTGGSCHGGLGQVLDYAKMVAKKDILTTMMNSGGSNGHPGGILSLSSCTISKFKEWIKQGQPQ